jgi:8-oxo-dGTP pyrophosphatase MutT (NUDIX family)
MDVMQPNTIISTRVIVEHDDKIVLLRRAPSNEFMGSWELPGGTVEPGETIPEAAVRETRQESGLDIELLTDLPHLIDDRKIWDGKHTGAFYKAYGFIGLTDSLDITLSDEHVDQTWLLPSEALRSPHLTSTSRKAILELGRLLNGWSK